MDVFLYFYDVSKRIIREIISFYIFAEAGVRRCSYEKAFWKFAANLQENTHAEVRFQ